MKMHSAPREQRLREFKDLCRRQGLPVTVQRRIILEVLLEREDHPTAEQVFAAVGDKIPGVSRTTVYRVLDTLVRMGVITRICHPGVAARFDPRIDRHHHLLCLGCGRIIDLEDKRLNALRLPAIDTSGYEVSDFQINLRGRCPECLRKADKRASTGSDSRKTTPNTARPVKRAGKRSSKTRREKP